MNFKETYDFFKKHIISINGDLEQYKTVFLESPGNKMIRENAGGLFFESYHSMFWNHLTLLMSKLTDERYPQGEPKVTDKKPKRENLVIDTLVAMASENGLRSKVQVNNDYEKVKQAISEFRDVRNKIYAHVDKNWAEKNESRTLFLTDAEAIIRLLESILKTISLECFQLGENFQPALSDDAFRLFFVLREGLILEKLQDSGAHLFSDNNPLFDDIPHIEKPKIRESL